MRKLTLLLFLALATLAFCGCAQESVRANGPHPRSSLSVVSPTADNPTPPSAPVKLIFVHHSCGENWLADGDGGLGIALRDANYFVSDANYEWGPDSIGDTTDVGHWYTWFVGTNSVTYTTALYTEYEQHATYSRLGSNPGGENEIVMFKSCYPNSHLGGSPGDPPTSGANPLRGQDAYSEHHTVANAKGIYNDLLAYFTTRQDKLFVVVTAPPLQEADTDAAHAANARALNDWLVHDWLSAYPHDNVAVFDFYNVLTSNGGDADTNDLGAVDGNHHRWDGSAVEHTQSVASDVAAYPGGAGGDSHPTAAGNQKATGEFVALLNVYYNRWQASAPAAPQLTLTTPTGATSWPVSSTQTIQWTAAGTVTHVNLYYSLAGVTRTMESNLANGGSYAWTTPPTATTQARVRIESVVSPTLVFDVSPAFTLRAAAQNHAIYLPLILRNYPPAAPSGDLVQPGDFAYVGAFRLPGDETPPLTFGYGGNAMTFNPAGDTGSGSLFIMGHDRQAWGGLPDGGQIAEVSIPTPVNSDILDNLNTATFIQEFANVAEGHFTALEELPRTGMAYLNHPDTGPLIHLSWGQHHAPDTSQPTYAWFNTTLTTPDFQGLWYIGDQDWYSLNGYIFEIPATWADAHAGGRYLGTGRQMDGGWGGMGPSLLAYRPWQAGGAPAISGTHLVETPLLLYEDTQDNGDVVQGAHTLDGHQHPDEWEGGAWITTPTGKAAVLFVGNKGTGAKYWYGYRNPAGPEYPCVNAQAASEFTACRLADGSPCPAGDMIECAGHTSAKGWWCAEFTPRFILYDPADLAQVAAGTMEAWEPQPYAHLDVGEHIFDNPADIDREMLGAGVQRRYLFGAAAYDRANGRLFVLELFADDTKPVVHVWEVR